MALSPAAAALVRALAARAGLGRDRILLISAHSVDWRSLTFEGERHEIALRVPGPDSAAAVARMTDGLADAELVIGSDLVADIALAEPPRAQLDGSYEVLVEALTVSG